MQTVKITKEKTKEYKLTDKQCKKITENYLRKIFDLPQDVYVKNEELWIEYEYHTSHTYWSKEKYRDMNEFDEAILLVLSEI